MSDGQVIYDIRGDNSNFQKDVNQTEKIAKSKSSAIAGFAKTALVGIGTAVTAAGAGMIAFSKSAVGAGSEFDKAMSQVAATMGVTVDEIQDLTNFAIEMGSTTAFSANEAAQALNYMALAGYDADTSMKMLPNVLNLAAAGNISLARASDMVTDAQSALGLSLDETNVLVDKMAKASSKSNTSVEQLGDAILTVGGTAKMLKGGTTELNTVLGLLADNGIKGAEGGTALRNIILALGTPTDQAAKKLKELGVEVYDDEGKMRSLEDVFGDLNVAMKDMNDGEQADVLNTIFNKVDLKSANALLATSRERWTELSGAIDDASGAAQQMAETQLDNLTGDVTLFKSALEGAQITLSNKLTPTLRNFVQFGTKEITKLDKAFKKGGIDGLADQLGKSLAAAAKKLAREDPKLLRAAGKLVLSFVDTILSTLVSDFPRILRKVLGLIKDLASSLVQRIPDLLSGIGSLIGEVIANSFNFIKLGNEILTGLVKGIIEGVPNMLKNIGQGFVKLFSPMSDAAQEATDEAVERMEALREKLDDIGMSAEEMYEKISGVDADTKMAEYWLGVFDKLKEKTNLTKEEQLLLNQAVEYLNTNVLPETQKIVQDESGKWQANTDAILLNIEAMKARKMAEIYLEKANGDLEKMVELELELDRIATENKGLQTKAEDIGNKLGDATAALKIWQKEIELNHIAAGDWGASWDEGTDTLRELAAMVGVNESNFKSWLDVHEKLADEANRLQGELDKTTAAMDANDGMTKILSEGYDMLSNSVDENMKKSAEWTKKAEETGQAITDGVKRGLESRLGELKRAARGVAEVALSEMKVVADIHSPSRKARKEIGEQIGKGEALGLEDSIPDVQKASAKLINAIDLSVPTDTLTIDAKTEDSTSAIIALLNRYLPRIGSPIVLDTGELVGATVDQYDHELGVLQQRRARYE